jgi:hypothetical protein
VGKAPAFVAAAFALPIDKISQPLRSEKNWHLIKVEIREEKKVQALDQVRARIETRLKNQQREEYGKAFSDSIMKEATIFDDSIRVALSPGKTAEDYFKEAQAAVTPLERIGLYRGLIARYPTARRDSSAIQIGLPTRRSWANTGLRRTSSAVPEGPSGPDLRFQPSG